MKTFWLFQRWDDKLWNAVEESEWEKIKGVRIVSGSLHLVEAKNLALALSTKQHKWFDEEDNIDEDGGMNKEHLLSEYQKRL
jgi:hypothetical protein